MVECVWQNIISDQWTARQTKNHKKGRYDGEWRGREMSDWGLMRHRKRIPHPGQLPLPLSLSVSRIAEEEISEREDLDLRTRARAGHVCVSVLMIVIGRRIEMG